MKHLFLVVLTVGFLYAGAQGTKPVYKKKAITKTPTVDSALIYYNLGFDFYKLDSIGAARYYWEKAAYSYYGKTSSRQAALYRLGLMQQNGEGVVSNVNLALDYYKKAAASVNGNLGNVDAIKNIAAYYESGIVVEKNDAKALEWYLKAKQAGNKYVDDDILRVKAKLKNN